MITVYLYSCNCGVNVHLIRNVKQWAQQNKQKFELKQSRYSEHDRIDHAMYLHLANMDMGFYDNIVIEDTGKITKLKEWQPSN